MSEAEKAAREIVNEYVDSGACAASKAERKAIERDAIAAIKTLVERAIAESQAPQPQCDCYAVFGNYVRPHFHDCPAGLWLNVPAQYKQSRWAFDYDEKNSTFFVHSGGHRICDAEDSEVASAICNAFNVSFLKG